MSPAKLVQTLREIFSVFRAKRRAGGTMTTWTDGGNAISEFADSRRAGCEATRRVAFVIRAQPGARRIRVRDQRCRMRHASQIPTSTNSNILVGDSPKPRRLLGMPAYLPPIQDILPRS